MITALKAYENYAKWKNYSQIERFVYSVLKEVITDERIMRQSFFEKEARFDLVDILRKIFVCEEKMYYDFAVIGWLVDYSEVPAELFGKCISKLVAELEQMYETDPENSYICKAFKALIRELEIVRGFKTNLDLERHSLTISWDLASTQNAE